MGKNVTIVLLAAGCAVLAWLQWGREADDGEGGGRFAAVREVVAAMREADGFRAASVGLCVIDASGAVVVDERAGEALIPASTMKTLVTATALEVLGEDYRFETAVGLTAAVGEDGTLDGDVVVVGGGDPTLGEAGLAELADLVVAAGVKRVTGRVVADARVFPEAAASDFWNWGDVGNAYGAPVCGLNYARNRLRLAFAPAATEGEPAGFVGASLELDGVEWENRVRTGAAGSGDGVVVYSGPYADRVTMRGTVPAGEDRFEVGAALPGPPRHVAGRLVALLGEAGIEVAGGVATSRALDVVPAVAEELGVTRSAPLGEIVRHINKVSDNVESQALFLKLGGEAEVRAHWAGRGLEFSGLRLEDGSGLARANHITSLDLARLNHLAATGPAGEAFVRLSNVYYDGRVRWKGGAMSSVRSYVGFVDTEGGDRVTFCLMVNHYRSTAREFAEWRRAVVEAVMGEDAGTRGRGDAGS